MLCYKCAPVFPTVYSFLMCVCSLQHLSYIYLSIHFFLVFSVCVCMVSLSVCVPLCIYMHMCMGKGHKTVSELLFSLHNVSLVDQRQVLRLWLCTYTLSHLTRPTLSITILLRLSGSVKNSLDLCCPGPRRVKALFDFFGFQVFSLFTLLVTVDHTIMQV